jgi:hypothetical protein
MISPTLNVLAKASPNGQKFAITGAGKFSIWDFDNSNGIFSNETIYDIIYDGIDYDTGLLSFSPNSQQLYITSQPSRIFQLDISSGSFTQILTGIQTLNLQLGPDNNIYCSNNDYSSAYYGVINNPDTPNNSSGFSYVQIRPPGYSSTQISNFRSSIPSFIDAIKPGYTSPEFTFVNLSCNSLEFTLDPCWRSYTASWNFGDASTIVTGSIVTHNYSGPGAYIVTCSLSIPGLSGNIIIEHNVEIINNTITINGPSTFCIGSSAEATYSVPVIPNATYSWSLTNSNGVINGLSNSWNVNVNWLNGTFGVVNVVITLPTNCIVNKNFVTTLLQRPNVSIAQNNPVQLCFGNSLVLNATSNSNQFQWIVNSVEIPGANSNSLTIDNLNVGEYVYSVIVTNNSCSNIAQIVVNVNPNSNIEISVAQTEVQCEYSPILTPTVENGNAPYSFQWLNEDNELITTDQSLLLSNYSVWGQVVTIVVTDAFGCTSSSPVITNDFITILPLPNLTPSTILSEEVYYLQGNVTVSGGDVVLSQKKVIALPNSSIIVQNSTSFIISNSHIYACSKMWNGINASNARFIGTERFTLIEDAVVAVTIENSCSYRFQNTTFNLNGKALVVKNSSSSPIREFYSNVVTRHNVISTWNYLPTNLRIDNSNNSGGVNNNLNSMVLSALKPLVNGTVLRPEGIEITNSSVPISVGSSASTNDRNIFDALDRGIVVRKTRNVTFINNTFNNICLKSSELIQVISSPLIGYGSAIDAEAINGIPNTSFASYTATFSAGLPNNLLAKNIIVNCTYGFKVKNYTDVRINLNSFTCSFNGFSSPSPSQRIWGQEAIIVSTEKVAPGPLVGTNIVAGINQNTINNFLNAIVFNRQNNVSFATNNAFYINSNIINPTTISNSTIKINNGIILKAANNTGVIARTLIQSNNIQNVSKNGIFASGYHNFDIKNNTNITLNKNATGGSNTAYNQGFAGILLDRCNTGSVFSNCNIGIGGANTLILPTYEKFRGIVLFASTSIRIYRNTIRNTGQCLAFYGTCTSLHSINDNTFINSRDGIVLRDNPLIGHQGHFTNNNRGSNNFWATGYPTPWQFPGRFMGSGFVTNSPLYYNQSTGAEVLNFLNGSRNPTAVGGTYQLASNYISVYPSFSSCSGGGGVPPGYIEDVPENEEALLEAADNSSAAEGDYSEAIKWYGEKFVYEELLRASTAIAEPDLQEFFDNKTEENLGKITDVEEKLMQGSIEDAKVVNDAILAENTIEEKHKFVNDEYYKFMKHFQDSITAEDTINQFEPNYQELKELGEASPLIYGPSTNRAATLWMHYFMKSIDLENLSDNSGGRFANNEDEIVEEETIVNNKYGSTVLPNPANTELNIFFGNNQTISHAKLFDSSGKMLLLINNNINTLQKIIDVSKFESGLYFIVFTNEQNQVLDTKKFVVQH